MKTYKPELLGDSWPWFISPKLNGVYAELGIDGLFRSKTGKFFPAVQKTFGRLDNPGIIYCGELYHHGWPLQKIISAISPDEPNELSSQINFFVHDCIWVDDSHQAFYERLYAGWPAFESIKDCLRFRAVGQHRIDSIAEGTERYKQYLTAGFEGAVYAPYEYGEKLKRKPFKDSEFLCTGIVEGKGKRTGHVGKFILRTPNGKTFGCGGGRVSYDVLRELFANPPIGKLLEVRYQYVSDKGVPLCAQFIRVRENLDL